MLFGKIKEKALLELSNEYEKRISKFAKLKITEIPDENLSYVSSKSDENKVKEIESNKIIEVLNKRNKAYVIALEPYGKELDSIKLSQKLQNIGTNISSNICFVIGGSLGLSEPLIKKSDEVISFSPLTFPHQLFRVMLLEQIFRSFKIINNETYHK